jgi:hypothetical protein
LIQKVGVQLGNISTVNGLPAARLAVFSREDSEKNSMKGRSGSQGRLKSYMPRMLSKISVMVQKYEYSMAVVSLQ